MGSVRKISLVIPIVMLLSIVGQSQETEFCNNMYQIYGTESVSLADRSDLQAWIFAPQIEVGNDSKITGILVAPNQLTLRDRVVLNGNLHWSRVFNKGNQVVIQGLVEKNAEIRDCILPTLNGVIGFQNVEVQNNDYIELLPGQYGDVIVRARSVFYVTKRTICI